jgi:capsular polysaccharide biosynthesis protein
MTDRDTNDSKSAQQPVMMPAYFPQPSDEIDLFELLEQLWRGKLTILGTMVLALALGAGASVLSIKPPATPSTEYTVSTTFTHMLFSILAQQNCGGKSECLDAQANRDLSGFIGADWLLSGNELRLVTDSPLSEEQYNEQLSSIINVVSGKILTDARAELALINGALNTVMLSTERVATSVLNATRVITSIESGTPVIAFKPVTISPPEPPKPAKSKTPIILVMSLILGSILGSVIVLFKNALQSRRKQSSA